MNELKIFDFESRDVRVLEVDGNPYFVGRDVAEILGYKNTSDAINRHVEEEDKLTSGITTSGQVRNMTIINESGLYSLIFSSELDTAKRFKRWVTSEVLPQIRMTGSYVIGEPSKKEEFEMQLIGAEYASKMLRVDESSKVRMLEAVHHQHGVPTNHLPVYVNEELKKSISDLLKERNAGISAIKANNILIRLGLLEIKERPSSKGKPKEFKSLTDLGLNYGSNEISPRNPRETQPLYYPSKFDDLLELILSEV